MRSSRAYTRLRELMEKYPDEDFTHLYNSIIAHTMIYMTIVQTTPETLAKNFEAIKGYYMPVAGKLEMNNPTIKKIDAIGKRMSIHLESITDDPNASDK